MFQWTAKGDYRDGLHSLMVQLAPRRWLVLPIYALRPRLITVTERRFAQMRVEREKALTQN